VLSVFILGAGVSFAQFGNFQNLVGAATQRATGGGVSISDLGSSRDQAISAYLESTKELDKSLEKAAEAFGVKKEVLEKLAVVESLKEGNVNDNDLDKARQSSQEAQAIIAQKMKETSAPSAEEQSVIGRKYDSFGSRNPKGYCFNRHSSKIVFSSTDRHDKCFANGNI
jgi:hypothetical protein